MIPGFPETAIKIAVKGFDTAKRQLDALERQSLAVAKRVTIPVNPQGLAIARRAQAQSPLDHLLSTARTLADQFTQLTTAAHAAAVALAGISPIRRDGNGLAIAQRANLLRDANGLAIAKRAYPVATPIPGMEKAAASLSERLRGIGDQLNKIGQKASRAFVVGTAGALAFAKAASPGDWMKFESAVARVSVQIGALMLPVIRTLTGWLNRLADALNKLTPAQREQIGRWAKLGLVVLGVAAAGTKLLGIVPGIVGGFSQVANVVKGVAGLFGLAGGATLGWVAAIAAAVAGVVVLAAAAVTAAGKWDAIGKAVGKLWSSVVKLGEALWGAVKPLLAVFGTLIAKYVEIVTKVYGVIVGLVTKVVEKVAPVVQKIAVTLRKVADEVMGFVDDMMEDLQPLIEFFTDTLVKSIELVLPVVQKVFTTLLDGLRQTVHQMRVLAEVMRLLQRNPARWFSLDGTFREAAALIRLRDQLRKQPQGNQLDNTMSRGPILRYDPEMFGISEAMRKAQTAVLGEGKDIAQRREQIALAKQANDRLGEIRDNMGGIRSGLR